VADPLRPVSRTEYHQQVARDMSEAALQARVIGLAKELGWMVYHTHDSRRSQPGWPDLALASLKWGRFLVAELKTERGRPTPDQRRWLVTLDHVGVETHVWRPTELLDGTILAVLTRPSTP
jgi:hypothetical protein